MRRPRILCVDDEPDVLQGLQRTLRRDFDVVAAPGGSEGLGEISRTEQPFEVIVSDMRMPKMNGAAFLSTARELSPTSVRVLLTGESDLASAVQAVNEGRIFRFLSKPCPPQILKEALAEASEYHRLQESEKVLLNETLQGCVKALSEVLALAKPEAFGRGVRVQKLADQIALDLGLQDTWALQVAAVLGEIGSVTLPERVVEQLGLGRTLTGKEAVMLERANTTVDRIVRRIPRMESVSSIISSARDRFKPQGDSALAASILRLATHADQLEARGLDPQEIVDTLISREGEYAPHALHAYKRATGTAVRQSVVEVTVDGLVTGMVLAQDVRLRDGPMLAPRGFKVTESFMTRAVNLRDKVLEPIRVLAEREAGGDPPKPEPAGAGATA